MTRFITLCGKKQVGKDTSAKYIEHILRERSPGTKVHIIHFADSLKEACSAIFGIPLRDMETETGKQRITDVRWPHYEDVPHYFDAWLPDPNGRFMTVRELLQFMGTDLFRTQMDPDIWVKSVFRRKYGENDIVIIADCRFPNEADFSRERGLLISVNRDTGLGDDGHVSETALDGYERYHESVDNNGTFHGLRNRLEDILKTHGFIN